MTVWLREVAGWLLVLAGLGAFALCYYEFALNKRVIVAGFLLAIGFWVFRGGQHLLKVAIAGRMCREVHTAAKPKLARRAIALGKPVTESRAITMPGPASK